jgi:hypothetical protein
VVPDERARKRGDAARHSSDPVDHANLIPDSIAASAAIVSIRSSTL